MKVNEPDKGFMQAVSINTALHYINVQHCGYLAFACEDGLVFRSEAVISRFTATALNRPHDDRVEEDFEVFPIVDGMVSLKAIRNHMGY